MTSIKTILINKFRISRVLFLYLILFSILVNLFIVLLNKSFSGFLGYFFFVTFSTFVFSIIWNSVYSGRLEADRAIGLYYFLVFVSFIFLLLFYHLYNEIFSKYFNYGSYNYFMASPIFLSGVISALVLGDRSYVLIVFNTAIISSIVFSDIPFSTEAIVFTSIVAGETMILRKGAQSILNGILAGSLSSFLFIVSLILMGNFKDYIVLVAPFTSAISVLFSVYGLVPLLESIFKVVTDIKLLEYANISHPLLKELMDKAPGTYNHSMLVSFLAEAAAYEVGANPILAKVGAMFHDIGKLKNPKYFIENTGSVSTHEKLSPAMSRLIIMSHVRDGVELAKKYGLPKCVIDIIEQHHGTTLIRYFYEKAKRISKDEVSEEIYRYPGPKPRTKESAIVMLADSIEAAVRSLGEPTPSKIKETIRSIVNYLFSDGQFEECPLNLRELKIISDVFLRMLISFYHKRISYPGGSNGNNSVNSTKTKSQ